MKENYSYSLWKYFNDLKRLSFISFFKNLYKDLKGRIVSNHKKIQNLTKTNLDLAIYHFNNGDIRDAIFRLNMLRIFGSFSPTAQYYIGRSYMERFKNTKAEKFLLMYKNSGDNIFLKEVNYCLKVIHRSADIEEVPSSIIAHNFDKIAKNHKAPLSKKRNKGDSQYEQIELFLKNHFESNNKSFAKNLLDLGCGSGLLAQHLKKVGMADIIVGVDISQKMLNIASKLSVDKKKVYSRTTNQDIKDFLSKSEDHHSYDLVTAVNLIDHLGNIEWIPKPIHDFAAKNSLLLLSFKENKKNKEGRIFMHTIEEFRYSKIYVKNLFENSGWEIKEEKELPDKNIALLFSKKEG